MNAKRTRVTLEIQKRNKGIAGLGRWEKFRNDRELAQLKFAETKRRIMQVSGLSKLLTAHVIMKRMRTQVRREIIVRCHNMRVQWGLFKIKMLFKRTMRRLWGKRTPDQITR